jgi:phage/plasmid primase-like uncharacterized protein
MSMSIAAGIIPDFIPQITAIQANQLLAGNMLLNIKPALDNDLSPAAHAIVFADNGSDIDGYVN